MSKSVAILDDELIFRNQIQSIIQKNPQLDIVINTSNPYDLLNYLEIRHLDLIILDMNMPVMTGLEFLEQLQLVDSNVKVLVVSGYADFSYATGSMKYGITNYILKHELDEDKFYQALNHINFFDEDYKREQTEGLNKLVLFFKQQLFLESRQELNNLYPNFIQEKMQGLIVIPINIGKKVWNKDGYKRKSLEVLEQIVQDFQNEKLQLVSTITQEGELFVLFSFAKIKSAKEINDLTHSMIVKLKNTARKLLDVKLFLMTNHLTNSLQDVLLLFTDTELILDTLFQSRSNEMVILDGKIQPFAKLNQKAINLFLSKIYYFTRYVNQESLLESVQYIFNLIRKEQFSRAAAIDLIAQVEFQISMGMSNALKYPIDQQLQVNYYQKFDTLIKIEQEFIYVLKESIENYQNLLFTDKDPAVQQCIHYIHKNYNREISLKSCSEEINMNYSYLSRVFSQQWSSSFSKYLNEVRIELAKVYLLSHQYSVSQVADTCGYSNYNYFFRIFKEYTGISPATYQNKGVVLNYDH